ncbi:hypothetical protein FWF93_02130 [Candidatus Saccharibacteria bacterium]|nr:hypothetical protein [Candidatus Saccharibacteria bacterium]
MSKISVNYKKILTGLFLAIVALPVFGGATSASAATTQTSGTTINVIVGNDDVDLSLTSINGKQSDSGNYTTTQDTARVVFEASGVGDIYIIDANGNVLYSMTKTTSILEEITAVFLIGDTPGIYNYILIMENSTGSKEVPFQITLEAVKLPEIPLIPDVVPGMPNTGYMKLFGNIVSNKGMASIVVIIVVLSLAMIGLFFVLVKKQKSKKKKQHPVHHNRATSKTKHSRQAKK